MPRTEVQALSLSTVSGQWPVQETDLPNNPWGPVWDTFDDANGMKFAPSGRDLILIHSLTTTRTLTLVASADPQKRTVDFNQDVQPGQILVMGPFGTSGWVHSDPDDNDTNKLYLDASGAGLEIIVVRL